jgi:hypothetical protein
MAEAHEAAPAAAAAAAATAAVPGAAPPHHPFVPGPLLAALGVHHPVPADAQGAVNAIIDQYEADTAP